MGLYDRNQIQGVLLALIDNGFKNNFILITYHWHFLEAKEVMLFPDIGMILCYTFYRWQTKSSDKFIKQQASGSWFLVAALHLPAWDDVFLE